MCLQVVVGIAKMMAEFAKDEDALFVPHALGADFKTLTQSVHTMVVCPQDALVQGDDFTEVGGKLLQCAMMQQYQ